MLHDLAPRPPPVTSPEVLDRLRGVCRTRGLPALASTLESLGELVGRDLARIEAELAELPRPGDLVGRSLSHLLALEGKRIRPLCIALSSRLGRGFDRRALDLAIAVEMVHSATLLHDDVVDAGTVRRGQPTARMLYGNAASVFAGDWLLIEALRLVEQAGVPGVMRELFSVIEEMIRAESLQLESRGRVSPDRESYFAIVEGKTAALFRWAMRAGGAAGGLDAPTLSALEGFGHDLGLAFQLVDDALDLGGDSAETGKALFVDLREGKMTFPLVLGLEREPALRSVLEDIVSRDEPTAELIAQVRASLERTGAIEAVLDRAREFAASASGRLSILPDSPPKSGLALVAEAAVRRRA